MAATKPFTVDALVNTAQSICIRITDTLWCFYKGVAIGATVLIARAYGAGRHQDCRKIAEQTILTEMIIVFIFQVVLYFKAPLFLGFFSKDPQILSLAEGYMKTIIFEFPFVVITTVVTASFQGYGNTKIPMYIAVLMNVVNIVCGYCFISCTFTYSRALLSTISSMGWLFQSAD